MHLVNEADSDRAEGENSALIAPRQDRKWSLLSARVNAQKAGLFFRSTLESGLQPILLKGWSLARFYPPNHPRLYTDIDLAFDPEYAVNPNDIVPSGLTLVVDFHLGLRKYDSLPWRELFAASYLVDLDGTPIRVLGDEDNLRVTAVHWLTDGGVNRERLWDIYYLVKNRRDDFDWERCLEANGPIRKTWVMAALATARDHLNLDVSGLPGEVQEFQLPDWYKKTLEKEWKRGIYPRRVLSTVITRPKLLAEQLYRRFPPNQIAATIDTETPINNSTRLPSQLKSLTKKLLPFARGLGRRLTYFSRGRDRT